ncbi:MAG: UDP-N-acetylmuramate-L-alanine ligase [Candidatus Falkowbacteria bacterium GW2011_GWC2_38_22]|uniref:UDP-N-acetylmuramate--L-alanine ligase n=1 Tax=Candidatus Falkowbacteria bacterium GW2011_GWE1_38_31 TaxID=1618638 RepID=A0A0G0MAE0_9BACT|nr:MAG: UDP-N-acetylmuramate-L-alanine ligase [Candidatus Falkowbacteria bacterium GW2011_GWF2_38_1205]KKQ61989.1 MAG: UDP-N-acetylmuramate-L-alanine ligase [Candidatus Falkowbacteria bacterium GW2011_GWC2_38_22]KKQ63849.1 MAG: UDP-N-acetylmuramate-L-alanine ligase [Candidatus Falkowbacteria bacterium GW2011_GWF1_38_22]KKQ66106.1 MAG: UDP-N-acetylmuramate-L-alanine ligase [Candidatus Falkowbacteria bacterium GW2011_GWE2_38_254]KKQ70709.1 MAG: UDP-N-acetylmuramate-L-alanine ligase [Candidatus Fa
MSLKNIKKIYMIGIKGVGMTMLAQFLSAKGYEISGSDVNEVFMTDEVLLDSGIKFFNGFSEKNIPANIDLIIHSTAYNENNNEELALVKKQNKKIMTYAEAMGAVFQDYFGIAVCGSHGKTTTTAWLAYVLKMTNQGPNAMIGARVPQLDGASIIGPSNYLIIEADEYQNKLKLFSPRAVLLNNIDYDHPDFFPTHNDYNQVFVEFIKKIPKSGWLVANFDDPIIRKIAPVNTLAKVISYAIDESADYVAYDIQQMGDRQYFKVKIGADNFDAEDDDVLLNTELGSFSIQLSGRHSIYNALAVIASAIELGVDLVDIRAYLGEFKGTARRMETMGKYNGALILDDYAHHPTEIKATLAGARQKYGNKKIRVVFHPHTFTRTKALLDDFAKSFDDADEVIVLDIYGSAREAQGGVHSKDLVEKLEVRSKKLEVKYIATQLECEKYLRDKIMRDDIIILMGAGDVFRIGEKLVK